MDSWLNDRKTIEKSIRPYAHFDSRTNIANVRQYISNPQKVAKHGFYPFIHYEKNMDKFKREKEKQRNDETFVTQHMLIDAFINIIAIY